VIRRPAQTGSREVVTHVVAMGGIRFAFSSQLNPGTTSLMGGDMDAHLTKHGDGEGAGSSGRVT